MPIMARKGAPRHAELTLQPCSVGTERRSILSCVPPCNAWSTLQLAGKIFVQCINLCTGMSSRVWNGQEREYVREAH